MQHVTVNSAASARGVKAFTRSLSTTGSIRVLAGVSIVLPLGLTGCAPMTDLGSPAAELRAASDTDLLTAPPEQVFDVESMQLLSPIDTTGLTDDLQNQMRAQGFLVMGEGVITAAELSVRVAGITEATFVLTEPAVLRREGRIDSTVYATGTLSVNGIEQRDTRVRLAPHELSEDHAEFSVSFNVPENPLTAAAKAVLEEGAELTEDEESAQPSMLDEVTARVELVAR